MNELTIFYTDDDHEDVAFFKEIVEIISDKYDVVSQNNGEQLLHALDNPPPNPHIVFLDINMPGMNGLEILKKVRNSEPHKKLPIIMFSTSNDETIIEKSWTLGANRYVTKSGIFSQLKKSVEDALNVNWIDFIPNKETFLYTH